MYYDWGSFSLKNTQLTENIWVLQVIGDVRASADLGPEDLVLVGTDGMLLAGPRAEALEPVAAEYARLRCRLDFCHVIHARLQQVVAFTVIYVLQPVPSSPPHYFFVWQFQQNDIPTDVTPSIT